MEEGFLKELKYLTSNFLDKVTSYSDMSTVLTGLVTASIPSKGMNQGAITGKDSTGDKSPSSNDLYQDREDSLIYLHLKEP